MQKITYPTIRIALFSTLVSIAFGSAVALAQSGSAGGSIGNDEKSLSGSRPSPRSAEPDRPVPSKPAAEAPRSKPAAEKPRRASRKSGGGGGGDDGQSAGVGGGGGGFNGSWTIVSQGNPCGGATERITISGSSFSGTWSSGSVSPNGSLSGRGSANGVSWTSSGRMSAGGGSGRFTRSDGCVGRWTASR